MATPILFRRRIVDAIENSDSHIVYIFGPRGYGKTLAAKQWAENQKIPTAWFDGYSTSSSSDLLDSILQSIFVVIPSLKTKFKRFESLPEEIDSEVLHEVVSIFEKSKLAFNLIIDNAELIRESQRDFARLLVSQCPRHIKLILLTNTSPRTSFLREHGLEKFTIISPAELCFTIEETKKLAQEFDSPLNDSAIAKIQEMTTGWPAGVQLATFHSKCSQDVDELVSTMKIRSKEQFNLASRRILAGLDKNELEILYALAWLEDIDSEAAFQVTEDINAVRILTLLSQESVIVLQTGFAPPVFKINPIPKRALLDELQNRDDFRQKSERVITFLLGRRDIAGLTKVLLELGEIERLSELLKDPLFAREIDASIQDAVARSALDELENWISLAKYVPELGDKARLILSFYRELLSGNFLEAESHIHALRDTIQKLDPKEAIQWRMDLYALEAISYYAQGRLSDSFNLAMQAYQHASQQTSLVRGHHISYLQVALWGAVIIDDDTKVEMIDEILESDFVRESLRHRHSVVSSMRALVCAHQGRFTEARNHLVIPLTPHTQSSYAGFLSNYGVKLAESMVIGESGNIEKGVEVLKENVESAITFKNFPMAIACLGRLGYHYLLLGKINEAMEFISRARELISKEMLADELHECVDIWEARVIYKLHDFKRTEELIKRANSSYLVRAFEAAININSNPTKALEITETFDLRNPRQRLTYHLFRAHIFGDAPASQFVEVKKAVEVGSKHGYFNHFLTQRSDVIQQYISIAAESPTSFNERLARAAGERLNEMMVGNASAGESLTRREADILRHLSTGLPLKDIAKSLGISKNTIKTHLRNLYRKLGAEDRKDAVDKGKRLLKV
mgnify:FL=1